MRDETDAPAMTASDERATAERKASPKGPPKSARRRSREFAVQGLYEWLLSRDESGANAGAIDAHIRETPGFDKTDKAHYDALLRGVIGHAGALREVIAPYLDRPIAELSPVEHGVLLVGAYELTHHVEIPYRVVINEAVELAKSFGGTDGFKYVNGVLDKVAADVRATEIAASRRGR